METYQSKRLKLSDLRIGNIVLVNNVNKNCLEYHTVRSGTDIDNAHWYWPAELTEDILKKIGFDPSKNDWRHEWQTLLNQDGFYIIAMGITDTPFYEIIKGNYILIYPKTDF